MSTESKPTPGAMRAVRYNRPELAERADAGERHAIESLESDAETVDRETGAKDLLEALKEIEGTHYTPESTKAQCLEHIRKIAEAAIKRHEG